MQCPKCHHENRQSAQFCTRCHTPLRFTCPSCKHIQEQGGKCERCGVDFAKYAAMLVFQASADARDRRERSQERASLAKQILLVPLTGGLSLVRYLFSRFRR
jgi:hypothetical protein